MNRLTKIAVLGLAAAATTLSALPAAQAGDGWRRNGYRHYNSDGDLVAAGVLGLAVGALAAGVATAPERRYYEPDYYEPEPVYREPVRRLYREGPVRRYYVREPEVVYATGALEPWSPEWYDYCESRYRSFNARTGTFTGYDGQRYFCQAN
ncbi:BA14K family protein [Mesorhizobium sp. LHD-90]|uniref:BA14K family protein n=1 Tax=Mesorhizobium sp. LHD-90 TaxID=3071414 RepID=UPI0027DFBFEE|nr:BA14K family protein [Mesorhizobium sp. LHD-90]MDQ6436710.1 BA14K family protein [Mesorhizobium sp. LHD-90]